LESQGLGQGQKTIRVEFHRPFFVGLLEINDWTGPWIKHPIAPVEKHIWFRKTFTLRDKAASAFIYVASVGYHELYVNGQKVDARVLAPSLTRLDKRVLYVTL